MKNRLSKISASIASAIRSYPVEMGLILYAFVFGVMLIEDVDINNGANVALVPLFFALAYSLNSLIKCPRGRWVYYLCWLPVIPLWFVDVEDWVESSGYVVALACAFLAFLVCRKARDNRRFAGESFHYLFDLMLAFFFSGIAHLLLIAIYYSTVYIFGLDDDIIPHFLEYTSLMAYVVFVPLLFLSFVRNNIERSFSPSRFFDVLMNFILTPALLVYATILYIYFAKIAFTWSLPEGGIALMVFAFTIIAVVVKAWQPLLGKRYYDWFFDNFSLISLPAVVMFWIGSAYRVAQYGFTEWRFYLILCGVIMTVTLAMFAFKGRGKYITVAIISMVLLALFTFIPPISAKNLSNKSQACRVERIAGRIGLLDADGNISKEARPESDTVYREDYHRMYESLRYLNNHDNPIYGLEYPLDIKDIFPGEWNGPGSETVMRDKHTEYYVYREVRGAVDISGFSKMYSPRMYKSETDYYYSENGDSLKIYYRDGLSPQASSQQEGMMEEIYGGEDSQWEQVFVASYDEIMQRLLAAASPLPVEGLTAQFFEEQEDNPAFFTYDTGDMRLVFDEIHFEGDNGELKITDLSLSYIFIK